MAIIKKAMKRDGTAEAITTGGLCSYEEAVKEIGNADRQEVGRWATGPRTHTNASDDESGRC